MDDVEHRCAVTRTDVETHMTSVAVDEMLHRSDVRLGEILDIVELIEARDADGMPLVANRNRVRVTADQPPLSSTMQKIGSLYCFDTASTDVSTLK